MQLTFCNTFLILLLSLAASGVVEAQGKKQYRSSDDVDLPPVAQRTKIGTWFTSSKSGSCTRSFESVGRKVYDVTRCSDGSGGNTGRTLSRVSDTKFLSPTSSHGDHYVILANGNLSVRDKEGEIRVETKYANRSPSPQSSPQSADAKSVGKAYGVTEEHANDVAGRAAALSGGNASKQDMLDALRAARGQ